MFKANFNVSKFIEELKQKAFKKDMFINIAVGELKDYIKHRQTDLKYKLNPSSWWSSKTSEENPLTPDKVRDQIKNPFLQELLTDEIIESFTNTTTDKMKLDSYCKAILAIAKVEDFSSAQECINGLEGIKNDSQSQHNEVKLFETALINIINRTKEMMENFFKAKEEFSQKVDKFWNESSQIKSLLSPEIKKQLNEYFEKKSSEDNSPQKSESTSEVNVDEEAIDVDTQKKKGPTVIRPVQVGNVTLRKRGDVNLLHIIVNQPESITFYNKIDALVLLDPSSYEQLIKQITASAPGNDDASQPKRALPQVPSAVPKSAPVKDNPSQPEKALPQNSSLGSDDPGRKLAAVLKPR